MGEEIKVFEIEECKGCPFKDLEINTTYFLDNKLNYETAFIKCMYFDSCKKLKTIFKE